MDQSLLAFYDLFLQLDCVNLPTLEEATILIGQEIGEARQVHRRDHQLTIHKEIKMVCTLLFVNLLSEDCVHLKPFDACERL